jgi:hypothetical protein
MVCLRSWTQNKTECWTKATKAQRRFPRTANTLHPGACLQHLRAKSPKKKLHLLGFHISCSAKLASQRPGEPSVQAALRCIDEAGKVEVLGEDRVWPPAEPEAIVQAAQTIDNAAASVLNSANHARHNTRIAMISLCCDLRLPARMTLPWPQLAQHSYTYTVHVIMRLLAAPGTWSRNDTKLRQTYRQSRAGARHAHLSLDPSLAAAR